MKTYWNINGTLNTIKEWQPNCWIQVTCPTEQDQQELENTFHIPDYFLSDISDTDERARYEYDDGWMLIILRIPYVKEIRSRTPYTTVPLGIIHKKDVTITVCNFETNMMLDFVSYQQKRNEGFTDYVDLIFEMSQARETTSIYSDILESTMDTYSSIINNNMNTVMRTLTSVSIVMMLPTLISSLFGMNLVNGMETNPWGFPVAMFLSVVVSAASWWLLRRKRLL